jgi:hypothetical protein
MGFPQKLKACGKRTFMIGLYGLSYVSNSIGFCLSTFDQFSHTVRVLLAASGLSILSLERVYSHSIIIMH